MSSDLSKIPSGVRYFFDDEVRLRRSIEQEVMSVFFGWSYAEVMLPVFDYQDLFTRGMGRARASKTYRFTDREGSLLALRPDLTSLVARTVATRFAERPRPLRLCYTGEIFRFDEPRAGRQYEFHHLGIEHIGSDRLEADIEVLLIAIESLWRLGVDDFRITIGNAEFFNGIVQRLQLDESQREKMRTLVDSRNLSELVAMVASLTDQKHAAALGQLMRLSGKRDIIEQAQGLVSNDKSVAALNDLRSIFDIAAALDIARYIEIDLGDVGGLDYYTGLTFHIFVPDFGVAVGAGGRYDQLIGNFGRSEPAVGFSLCLDWLAQLLANRGSADNRTGKQRSVILNSANDLVSTFLEAKRTRLAGKSVEIKRETN